MGKGKGKGKGKDAMPRFRSLSTNQKNPLCARVQGPEFDHFAPFIPDDQLRLWAAQDLYQ